jgi:hypothetical protein
VNKREVVWLLIRIAGLYFFWHAIENGFSLIAGHAVAREATELLDKSGGIFIQAVLRTCLYLWLGLYCIGGGHIFFRLLTRQPLGEAL